MTVLTVGRLQNGLMSLHPVDANELFYNDLSDRTTEYWSDRLQTQVAE